MFFCDFTAKVREAVLHHVQIVIVKYGFDMSGFATNIAYCDVASNGVEGIRSVAALVL